MVLVENTGGIGEYVAIDLPQRYYSLDRIPPRMINGDEVRHSVGQWTPTYLEVFGLAVKVQLCVCRRLAAVILSIHSTKGSDVIYRESDSEYSFQS